LVAVANGGYVYASRDSGTTWGQTASVQPGASEYFPYMVASSSDGTKLVVVSGDGSIYTSIGPVP
jgi:hypothetical protein